LYNQISISLSDNSLKKLDQLAKHGSMSRSQLCRKFIQSSLDSIETGYHSFRALDNDFMISLEHKIIEIKSELKKLEYQRDMLRNRESDE
jgi:metal-responsive CopG/Arc/MetJ family transcriptional regulator